MDSHDRKKLLGSHYWKGDRKKLLGSHYWKGEHFHGFSLKEPHQDLIVNLRKIS